MNAHENTSSILLRMFRTGRDTNDIAKIMKMPEAKVSKAIWIARCREREQPAEFLAIDQSIRSVTESTMFAVSSKHTMRNAKPWVEPNAIVPVKVAAPAPIAYAVPKKPVVQRPSAMPGWVFEVVQGICERRGADLRDVLSDSRTKATVAARNECFYVLKQMESPVNGEVSSYPRVADWFGREHTMVLYGAAKHALVNGLPPINGYNIVEKMERNGRRIRLINADRYAKRAALSEAGQ